MPRCGDGWDFRETAKSTSGKEGRALEGRSGIPVPDIERNENAAEDTVQHGSRVYRHLEHEFPPLFDRDAETLILGSFPSVKSREQQFYYGHPQNRFWKVLAALYGTAVPETRGEKTELILSHHLALWDVIDSCDILGSSDASIRNAVVTDLPMILDRTRIDRIFINGATAWRLYEKYQKPAIHREAVRLPSTSPANATWSLDRLIAAWRVILPPEE